MLKDKTKRCCRCGEVKGVDLFYNNKRNKGGKSYGCKVCDNIKHRQYGARYSAKNKEKLTEYSKRYRKEKPEKNKESKAKYVENNPEKRRESDKKYKEKNREKIREKDRELLKKSTKDLTDRYIKRACFRTIQGSVTPGMIEAKRIQLQLTRYIKENTK